MSIIDSTITNDDLNNFETFLRRYYWENVLELANNYPSDQQSLVIDWSDLYQFNAEYADRYLADPKKMGDALEAALTDLDLPVDKNLQNAHVRVTNLNDMDVHEVGAYRADQLGSYLGVNGQVSKVSGVNPRLVEAAFECQRCGTLTHISQTTESFQEPHECEGCERQGPFDISEQASVWTDYQIARVQQPPEQAQGGQGQSIDVALRSDLVDSVSPGDRATVSGRFCYEQPDDSPTVTTYIDGEATEVESTDFEEIDVSEHLDAITEVAAGERGDPYELLVESLAPKLKGNETIKEAVLLQMFGGVRAQHPDGTLERGDSHVLLLGDPGTGKSSLLRAVEELAPRSVYASGKGASAAGMTAAAVPDDFGDTKWSLEAGALVLANKGVACVDEIDKVQDDARSSMHDALEAQRVTVNKAGINATLPAETALLAAGNPKYGRFDPHESYADQIDLGPTLLSRFDLMFMVSDQPDREEDREIGDHMIQSRQLATKHTHGRLSADEADDVEPPLSSPVIRAYIAHAKQSCYPTIRDDEVREKLREFFAELRVANGEDSTSPVPVTYRKLEAIQRLAEASARVRLSQTVTMDDVTRAIRLVSESMRDVGVDPDTGQFDADVVESGTSQSQRERRKWLRATIEDLQKEHSPGAPLTRVLERAQDGELDADAIERDIESLLEEGRAYRPGNSMDHLRVI